MMTSLFWKDSVVNRMSFLAVLGLFGLPFLILPFYLTWVAETGWSSEVARHVAITGLISLSSMIFAVAVFGASAFAAERAEGSAEFLAVLPPTRLHHLISKSVVALVGWGVPWAIGVAIVLAAARSVAAGGSASGDEWVYATAAVGITFGLAAQTFGLAWMFSSFVATPSRAGSFAMWASTILFVIFAVRAPHLGATEPESVGRLFLIAGVGIGLTTYLIGCRVYLKRTQP